MPLFALTVYWHWFLKGHTNHGHKSTKFIFFDNSLLKEKILSKDHNGERKQWHDQPAIFKYNLNLILVFVKHSPVHAFLLPTSDIFINFKYIIPLNCCEQWKPFFTLNAPHVIGLNYQTINVWSISFILFNCSLLSYFNCLIIYNINYMCMFSILLFKTPVV